MTDEEKQRKIAEENKKLNNIREQANLYADALPEFSQAWMKKRLESYAIKNDYNLPPANDIGNTMDWLHGLQESDPKLAGKIDRISWESAQQHQEKWHDDLAKKAEKLSEFKGNPDDVTTMIKYEDGFKWVKLNSAEAKDFEGNAMGNCVGSGGYDDKTIFSLRDKDNFPHVTVEYDENSKTINQMKCKGNSEVADNYIPVVKSLIGELKPKCIRDIDYAISKDGECYFGKDEIEQATENGIKFDTINIEGKYALSKEGELYRGFSDIYDAMKNGVKFDKDNIYIIEDYALSNDGTLYMGNDIYNMNDSGIKFNEQNIYISESIYAISKDGSLFIGDDKIKQAYENGVKFEKINPNIVNTNSNMSYAISTDGTLYLGEDAINKIPEGIVLKDVNIRYSKNITEWNYKVEGNFNAYHSGLTKIGPNASFGGDVDIRWSENLTEWNYKVPGGFDAYGSGLTKIGPNASFGGDVDISRCRNLTEFNHKVPGRFFAEGSSLTTIGPNASFGGDVKISRCRNLTEFNHKVPGRFFAEGSSLTTIGPNAEFGDFIGISGTPLSKEIGMDRINSPEEKKAFMDAIKSMDSKQEPEQTPEPEEEYSMKM